MTLVFLGCCLGTRLLLSLPRLPPSGSAEPRALLIQDAHGEVSAASPLGHALCEAVGTTFLCPKEQVHFVDAFFRSTEAVQGGAAHGEPLAVRLRSPLERSQTVLAPVVSNGGGRQQLLRPREIDPGKLKGSCQPHPGALSRLRSDECLFSSLLLGVALLLHQTERHRAFPGGEQEQIHRLHPGTVSVRGGQSHPLAPIGAI